MIIICALLFGIDGQAKDIEYSVANYEEAERAPHYFKFIGHSRKLGIIGASFEGYAKKVKLHFDPEKGALKNVRLSLTVADLDTDNNSRNEKMWEKCLDQKNFPEIEVALKAPIDQAKEKQEVEATMKIRGNEVPLKIEFSKDSEGNYLGATKFSLEEAKIPDPSILVASVRDVFEIEFRVKP